MFLNFKTNIFQHCDIITKNRSLLDYDGHSALLKFLDNYTVQNNKNLVSMCVCGICLLEYMCMCVR